MRKMGRHGVVGALALIVLTVFGTAASQDVIAKHEILVRGLDGVHPAIVLVSLSNKSNNPVNVVDPFFKTPMSIAVEAEKAGVRDTFIYVGDYSYETDSLRIISLDAKGVADTIEIPVRTLRSRRFNKVCTPFVAGARWRIMSTNKSLLAEYDRRNKVDTVKWSGWGASVRPWKTKWTRVPLDAKPTVPENPIERMLSRQEPCW